MDSSACRRIAWRSFRRAKTFMHTPDDTIAAIATPLGEGGLGVVRVSGPAALLIVSALFKPLRPVDLTMAPSHTCHVGTFGIERPIDQVVVTLFRSPHSYTGQDVVELSA